MTDRTDKKSGQTNFLAAVLTAIYAYMIEEQYTEGQDQDVKWDVAANLGRAARR